MSWILPEAQRPFLVAERPLDLTLGEVQLPHSSRARVHPVDQKVEVRVVAVAVRHDHRVVIGESEVEEELVRDARHRLPRDHVLGVEAHREMVDRLLGG